MKLSILFLFLPLVSSAQFLQYSEEDQVMVILESYKDANSSPIAIAGHQKFVYQGDSLYLIPPKRMAFYKKLHRSLFDSINTLSILRDYQAYLTTQESFLQELKQALSKNYEITRSTLSFGKEIEKINSELSATTTLLNNQRIQIEKMDKIYRRSTKGSFGSLVKTFFAASIGASIAILVLK